MCARLKSWTCRPVPEDAAPNWALRLSSSVLSSRSRIEGKLGTRTVKDRAPQLEESESEERPEKQRGGEGPGREPLALEGHDASRLPEPDSNAPSGSPYRSGGFLEFLEPESKVRVEREESSVEAGVDPDGEVDASVTYWISELEGHDRPGAVRPSPSW